jgi:hypothetical protein
LEEPFQKIIPTLAPVSLPAVGGFATARSEAFNLDDIISCSSAYTRVSGREHPANGLISILITSAVEGLNILEVVTAERIVAQVSMSIPNDKGPLKFSLAGSRFEGLRLAGRDTRLNLNAVLQQPDNGKSGHGSPLTWQDIQKAGRDQAKKLISSYQKRPDQDAYQWAQNRHGWMTSVPQPGDGGNVLCSLVDGVEDAGPNESCHIVEIPGFGRIFLGELRVSRNSVQLVMIRAELGCPVNGGATVSCVGGGGSGDG